MNTHTHAKTGFGLHDTARQIARRRREDIQKAENTAPKANLTPEQEQLAELMIYARKFKRPLAA